MRNSDATGTAVAAAEQESSLTQITGSPLRIGYLVEGNISVGGEKGDASLTIPVTGPLSGGSLFAEERLVDGHWAITRLEFQRGDHPEMDMLQIIEPPSNR